MGQASAKAAPGLSAGSRRKGFKAELDQLRDRMRGLGLGHGEIAAEIGRWYRVRPREAYRLAWGWTLEQAAARFNERAGREGTDPQARATMTGPHLCEYEKWPRSTRRPSAYVLCMLAVIYEAEALDLLDLADHEGLPQQERLVLLRPPLAGMARAVFAGGDPQQAGSPGLAAADGAWPGAADGVLLALPYVPGRLVIEVSGPAGRAGLPAGGEDCQGAPGRLALVRYGSSWADGSDAG